MVAYEIIVKRVGTNIVYMFVNLIFDWKKHIHDVHYFDDSGPVEYVHIPSSKRTFNTFVKCYNSIINEPKVPIVQTWPGQENDSIEVYLISKPQGSKRN